MAGVLVLLLILSLSRDVTGCNFPYFMESYHSAEDETVRRDWRTHWRQHADSSSTSSTSVRVVFDGSVMRSEDTTWKRLRQMNSEWLADNKTQQHDDSHTQRHGHKHSRLSFTRHCRQIVVNDDGQARYLATHRQVGQSASKFICIEFMQRSNSVVQTKESSLETVLNRSLCEDELMSWNHWLLIDRSQFFAAHRPCPLHGGFNFRVFDALQQAGICDAYDGETRLEAECTADDGLVFRFRNQRCVPPDLDAAITQRIYCVDTWSSSDDSQTYAVLRHDTLERAWCLRYPTHSSADEGFLAYLFLDLRCHTGRSTPTATNRYLRLAITRDSRHDGQSLCVDDYEACSYWASLCPNTSNSVVKMTCAKSCYECRPNKQPSICSSLPQTFHGSWIEINQPTGLRIAIDSGTLSIDGVGTMTCVSWNSQPLEDVNVSVITAGNQTSTPTPTPTSVWQQMVVTTLDSGCRPRYSCVQLIKHAPSVLHYRLSQSQIWPPNDADKMSSSKEFDCDWFRYKDDVPPLGSKYRSKHFKVAAAADRERRQYVDCRLQRSLEFNAVFSDCNVTTECSGRLTAGTQPHSLQFIVDPGCQCWQKINPSAEEFRCLESTFGYVDAKDWMIVSESVIASDSDAENIVCWLLAIYGHTQNAIYRLTAEQCNSGQRDHVSVVQLRPVATLVEVRHGSVGWFDAVTNPASPGPSDDVQEEQGRTATTSDSNVYTDDGDWSFLDGSPVINVYNEPYVATDWDDDEQPPRNSAVIIALSAAPLACVSLMFAL